VCDESFIVSVTSSSSGGSYVAPAALIEAILVACARRKLLALSSYCAEAKRKIAPIIAGSTHCSMEKTCAGSDDLCFEARAPEKSGQDFAAMPDRTRTMRFSCWLRALSRST